MESRGDSARPAGDTADDVKAFYRRYLQRCNEHRFDELGEFVHEDVVINGEAQGLQRSAAGLAAVVDVFPDFHWDLQHLLVDGSWMSAHLFNTGATRTGRSISAQEFAVYRVADGRIAEVWGDLDRDRLASEAGA